MITVPDTNLVIASHVVQSNKIQETIGVAKIVDSVVATRNGIFERKSDLVEATIRNTETANKLVDADDVLLMRLGSENNSGAPSTITFADPTIGLEDFEVLHDNVAFMRPVAWFLAANGRRATSVDGEFEVEDGFLHTSFVKAVPVALDDGNDRSFDDRVGIGADYKILLELGKITVTIPTENIGFVAADGKGLSWVDKMLYRIARTRKHCHRYRCYSQVECIDRWVWGAKSWVEHR